MTDLVCKPWELRKAVREASESGEIGDDAVDFLLKEIEKAEKWYDDSDNDKGGGDEE